MALSPNNTHQIFSSRVKVPAGTYIGQAGRIFYHEDTGELRLSDGVTPGGLPIIAAGGSSSNIANITSGTIDGTVIGNTTPAAGTFTTLTATSLSGTLTTNAQPNITSVGTLTGLTVSGNTNLSLVTTPNAQITGGSITNTPISGSTGSFTTLSASGVTNITDTTQSTLTTNGALIVAGGVGIGKNLNVGGNVVISGNLTIQGTQTTVNSTTVTTTDTNITLANGATDAAQADGAGLTVAGANATIQYSSATNTWNLNKDLIATNFSGNSSGTNTGDQDLSGYELIGVAAGMDTQHLTNFNHGDIAHTNRAALNLVSGINTGDQDLSSYALNANVALKANISGQVFTGSISATNLSGTNTGDQDLSGYELIGVAAGLDAQHLLDFAHGDIAHANRAALDLVSGTNTGDQDLSSYATKVELTTKANISGQVFTGSISATNLSGTNTGDQINITGNAGTANLATNIAGGLSGSIFYQTAANTTTSLGIGINGQVLTLAAGLPVWADAAASGTPDEILSRHNGAISQTFNTTPTILLFDSNSRTDASYSYLNGSVTINVSGTYEIDFAASYASTANNVTTCQTAIYKNGVLEPGTIAYSNHTSSADGKQTTSAKLSIPLVATDVITIVGVRIAGAGSLVTQPSGCRLNIIKVR